MSDQEKRFTSRFVTEEEIKYLPPYIRDVQETPKPVRCPTSGSWPEWLCGDFVRCVHQAKYQQSVLMLL